MKIISTAPGRVCLFGDHQDYLGLPVIACAIDRKIILEAYPNNSKLFRIELPDINDYYQISISDPIPDIINRDYFASSLRIIRKQNIFPEKGYDIQIHGDIPVNAGLSSSSALIIAWINFLMTACGTANYDRSKLAFTAYEAEVTEHGESGGMMDQYTIALGNIQYIFQNKGFFHEQIGTSLNTLVIGESGIPKDTVGLLKEKKEFTLKAVNLLSEEDKNFKLNEIDAENYYSFENRLPKNLKPYFYAAVHNHLITEEALKEFSKTETNLNETGLLMNEHHNILRDKLKITVPLIDQMITAALKAGAYGAKIVGSGGGGCIVALADDLNKQEVINSVLKAGAKDAYEVNVSNGAEISIYNDA